MLKTIKEVADESVLAKIDTSLQFSFSLNKTEQKTFKRWRANHLRYCDKIGRDFVAFSFYQTHVGVVVKATCGCGKVKDLTDYGCW